MSVQVIVYRDLTICSEHGEIPLCGYHECREAMEHIILRHQDHYIAGHVIDKARSLGRQVTKR